MRVIPLAAVPTQTLDVILDRQATQIALRQNGANMYFDLLLGGAPVVLTRIVRDRQLILTDAGYRGFHGEFLFVDLQGTSDPNYLGLGAVGRYQLVFLSEGELPENIP